MSKIVQIHAKKQGHRPHFIADWAEARGLRQVDIAEAVDASKGIVSKWFSGSTPLEEYQIKLAHLFTGDDDPDPGTIFRHPDDDWMRRFLRGRSKDEVAKIKATLEFHFSRKRA
jgi:transcriptional regulator with XRE-family HTH domain